MKTVLKGLLAAAICAIGVAGAPSAFAADFIQGVYASDPGVCGDSRVLSRITQRFRHQVRNVPNLPDVAIEEFARIGQTRYLPQHANNPVERRYCHAQVWLSDGNSRPVWYLIEVPWGFAGVGANVEFCVSGFDRWHVYNGHCRVLR